MLPAVAETDEHLLARWRETLTTLRGYDGQQLDPVDRQTRNELRQQLERAEAELDRRGLRTTAVTPSGPWQPLPLHERPPEVSPVAVEPTWEPAPRDEPKPADELAFNRNLREFFDWPDDLEPHWWFGSAALRQEWRTEQARELPVFANSKPLFHRKQAPFVPELTDGLTAAQRLLFERLAEQPSTEAQLLSNPPMDRGAELERALAELRLSRRYPLLHERQGVLHLNPLAMEMVSLDAGRVRVHGGFFPNLLSNGVADGLVLPTFDVEGVITAASLLISRPGASDLDILHTLRSCSVGNGLVTLRTNKKFGMGKGGAICLLVEPRQWTQTKRLEFHFPAAADADRAAERLRLAQERHEFAEGTHHGVFEGTKLGVTLPPGVHGVAVVRRLMMDRALESWWQVDSTAIDVDGARPRTVREMLVAFVHRSREEVERRLRRLHLPADDRLEVIEGLLRVASDERLAVLVDAAASKDEARWALTHLGSLELTAHSRLGRHALRAEPFSERQAAAIVSTTGLHRKLHLLERERTALLEALEARGALFRPAEVDRVLHLELARVAATARGGQAEHWHPDA